MKLEDGPTEQSTTSMTKVTSALDCLTCCKRGAHLSCECLQSGAEPRLGEETTDESEGEASHYSARRNEILDNAATVFADASEEFGALPTVKRRLEAWKATQGGAAKTPEPCN